MTRRLIRWMLIALHLVRRPDFVVRAFNRQPTAAQLKPGIVAVVGNENYQKWACLICPGGCGEKIMLSLSTKRHPRWSVRSDIYSQPTIEPSVWQQNECGCHFWIRGGMVEWCKGGRPQKSPT